MLSFKPAFSLSSFTLIKKLFSSSSLSVYEEKYERKGEGKEKNLKIK